MQKITTFLWFNDQAEEAAKFYCSIFKRSKITSVSRYGNSGPGKKGKVMSAMFTLEGQEFIALNGGPHFTFTPAISLYIDCKTQKEVDELWRKLSKGGEESRCGWLKDKYGLSWQVVPSMLRKVLNGKSAQKSANAMRAMMEMGKLDIAKLEEAYAQG